MILISYINIPSSDEEVETWVKNFFEAIIVCARARVHTADCATPSPCSSFGFLDMYVSALRAFENENPDKAGSRDMLASATLHSFRHKCP